MNFKVELGARLRAAMEARRLSQQAVGAHMGVHQTQVGKWVRGVNAPSVEQLCRLVVLLDVPISSLLGWALGANSDPDLTDDERAAVDLMRALGLSKSTALRRLATPHPNEATAEDAPQLARPVGATDLSRLPLSPTIRPPLEGEPEGEHDATKTTKPPSIKHRRRGRS